MDTIVIDFDIKDEDGKKSYEGIHLHYIYDGDPELLDPIYFGDKYQ